MGPKLLFLIGIVVTHAAVGAAFVNRAQNPPHAVVPTCTQPPTLLPHYEPQAELLVLHETVVTLGDRLQP
jgi:hypothetical protein